MHHPSPASAAAPRWKRPKSVQVMGSGAGYNEASAFNDDDAAKPMICITIVGVREPGAWFRGRYSHVPVSDIDSVSSLSFPGNRG